MMWQAIKNFFSSPKTAYELLLEHEADPHFKPADRFEIMPDGTFKRIPYIRQPKPCRYS